MRWDCYSFETVSEAEGVLEFSFPVDDVRHDLELVFEVSSFDDFFDASMELSLSRLLGVEVRADSMHQHEQIHLFLAVILHLLHAEVRVEFDFVTPRGHLVGALDIASVRRTVSCRATITWSQ